jgi:hypothetical protein
LLLHNKAPFKICAFSKPSIVASVENLRGGSKKDQRNFSMQLIQKFLRIVYEFFMRLALLKNRLGSCKKQAGRIFFAYHFKCAGHLTRWVSP